MKQQHTVCGVLSNLSPYWLFHQYVSDLLLSVFQVAGMSDWPGLQVHSHNYRDPKVFTGMNVLVVGASFSGGGRLNKLWCHTGVTSGLETLVPKAAQESLLCLLCAAACTPRHMA